MNDSKLVINGTVYYSAEETQRMIITAGDRVRAEEQGVDQLAHHASYKVGYAVGREDGERTAHNEIAQQIAEAKNAGVELGRATRLTGEEMQVVSVQPKYHSSGDTLFIELRSGTNQGVPNQKFNPGQRVKIVKL